MLGMHLDLNFQDLISNQKGFPFESTEMITCIRVEKLPNQNVVQIPSQLDEALPSIRYRKQAESDRADYKPNHR